MTTALVMPMQGASAKETMDVAPKNVVSHYADMAHAMYEDALLAALQLDQALKKFVAEPSEDTLLAARYAWIAARTPYQKTEGFRFGNEFVDDWEGRVNAWPLDEGMIDYVSEDYASAGTGENPLYSANVVANESFELGGKKLDASKITKELLADSLHEAETIEANVATGYHAIEFLLWGQDLYGTEAGAGKRPATDFDVKNCTNGNCDRRAAYLTTASELMLDDLKEIVAAWAPKGAARAQLDAKGEKGGLAAILKGLGSLSYGELAGERMKLGLMIHDPEEEHDCFSDNTHNSHFFNQSGMIAIYNGRYARIDGSVVEGPSVADLVAAKDKALGQNIATAMTDTQMKMAVMKLTADNREMAYDQMLAAGNEAGNKILEDVINSLVAQAKMFEKAVSALDLEKVAFEGSDSLDNPSSVVQ